MTGVGHTLMGVTIGVLFAPRIPERSRQVLYYLLFAFCAMIPDIEVSGWGHDKYHISHSIVLMALLTFSMSLLITVVLHLRKRRVNWRLVLGLVTAWISHFVLDGMYNHGKGVWVMWPLSKGRLNIPLPWFSTTPPYPLTFVHIKIYAIELLFYLSVLLMVILLKKTILKRRLLPLL